METENKYIPPTSLRYDSNHIFSIDGKQHIGITYLCNMQHDGRGRQIKDTSAETNAKEIVKRYNMHNEALDIILQFIRESKSDTDLVKRAADLLNRNKE